jgi:hypothetical protein
MTAERGFIAELAPDQDDAEIGQELIRVRFDDGHVEELRLHDYERVYSLPGVYEQIVHERLGCRSPAEIAEMLGTAADGLGIARATLRVLDVAAGNGLSGAALAAAGMRPVVGTDIVPAAQAAALRDRPDTYEQYLTLDLLNLSEAEVREVRELRLRAVCCVAPVGEHSQQLPAAALAAAVLLVEPDALVAYMHDLTFGTPDPITPGFWRGELGSGTSAELLARRRYLHRYRIDGSPYEMEGLVWRVRRGDQAQ